MGGIEIGDGDGVEVPLFGRQRVSKSDSQSFRQSK
jgi:hypothetical protein